MFIAAVPPPMTSLGVFDFGHIQAFPFASNRATAAHSRELIDQRTFRPVFVTKNDRADFATVALVNADNLLAIENCTMKQTK